ncbi:hypothetical protein [Rhizobium sp. SL42]|uniref:hypothetical protein n=1 Tax=Rhizobium sp. SL42 TaxID=2806346 RepID=UPI001F3F1EE0|nr:hypothetical protein [Rhizobium sp. SL42]UJW73904.1 hypothetical protein IM739_13530 [Rhizobium sp. SL42]
MKTKSQLMARILRIFCAMVFLSLGFAHKPPQAMASPFLSASYQLPDGSFADLCVSDTAVKHDIGGTGCDVCRLHSMALLPTPDHDHWLISVFPSLVARLENTASRFVFKPVERPRSRGPPAFA